MKNLLAFALLTLLAIPVCAQEIAKTPIVRSSIAYTKKVGKEFTGYLDFARRQGNVIEFRLYQTRERRWDPQDPVTGEYTFRFTDSKGKVVAESATSFLVRSLIVQPRFKTWTIQRFKVPIEAVRIHVLLNGEPFLNPLYLDDIEEGKFFMQGFPCTDLTVPNAGL
jgi:hypothetical protein